MTKRQKKIIQEIEKGLRQKSEDEASFGPDFLQKMVQGIEDMDCKLTLQNAAYIAAIKNDTGRQFRE